MPKKEELTKLVRGKGLEAFRPVKQHLLNPKDAEEEPGMTIKQTAVPAAEKISGIADDSNLNAGEAMDENPFGQENTISVFIPSPQHQQVIELRQQESEHQIFILDAFIQQGTESGNFFKKKEGRLTFNILIVTTGVLTKLKHQMQIYWNTFDLLRWQGQPFYDFSMDTVLQGSTFKISHIVTPVVKGYFKFGVVVDIPQIEMVSFFEGDAFKIH